MIIYASDPTCSNQNLFYCSYQIQTSLHNTHRLKKELDFLHPTRPVKRLHSFSLISWVYLVESYSGNCRSLTAFSGGVVPHIFIQVAQSQMMSGALHLRNRTEEYITLVISQRMRRLETLGRKS